jgi:hypothetical protein
LEAPRAARTEEALGFRLELLQGAAGDVGRGLAQRAARHAKEIAIHR